jgi:hypothetical protein
MFLKSSKFPTRLVIFFYADNDDTKKIKTEKKRAKFLFKQELLWNHQ